MKKLFVLLFAAMLGSASAYAQSYNWAVGARIGGEQSGISVKHFFNASDAIEGVVGFPYDGAVNFLAMYERHLPVIGEGFSFYYGGGAHIGAWDHDEFAFGVDGVVGLEYKIKPIPLALSLDYKPSFNLVKHFHWHMVDFGLGIKFTF